jgi:chaperonin GroEL (HSP60 family)
MNRSSSPVHRAITAVGPVCRRSSRRVVQEPTGTFRNLVGAGIIDPTKVVRLALEHAVSVAGVLLLAEATLTELPEEAKASPSLSPQDL